MRGLLHRIDPGVQVEESLGVIAKLQQQGKIRHVANPSDIFGGPSRGEPKVGRDPPIERRIGRNRERRWIEKERLERP